MATYVTLFRYTQPGITTIKDSPGRIDAMHAKPVAPSVPSSRRFTW